MSNPRDDRGNVQVDFVWGNIPMQPNDDRGEAVLDPYLDSHVIVTTQYEGFPAFTPGYPFDDTIQNVTVPNLIGLVNPTAAQTALENVGLILGNTYSTTVGATSENNLNVKIQSVPSGSLVNSGSSVDITCYNYVEVANPISGFDKNPRDHGWDLSGGDVVMYLVGRTVKPATGNGISVSGSSDSQFNQVYEVIDVQDDDGYNTGGTAVRISPRVSAITDSTSSGGTWTRIN